MSFAEEFRLFVNGLKETHDNNSEARSVLSTLDLFDTPDQVWGRVNAGGYGMVRDVVKSDTNERAYKVAPNEAVLHPFYFLLNAPPKSSKAVYILQRHGNSGVHTAFTDAFRKFFSFRNPDLIFDVQRHVPREVLEYLERGALKKVEYTSYKIPKELEEVVRLGEYPKGTVVVRTSITARKRGTAVPMPDWVPEVVKRRLDRVSLLEAAPVTNLEEEKISLTFRYNGNDRTLNLARPDALAPYVDVTAKVKINDDGHPDFNTLHKTALSLKDDILAQMGSA